MTELEFYRDKFKEERMLCTCAYYIKHGDFCDNLGEKCSHCQFDRNASACIEQMVKEHKENKKKKEKK